MTTIPLTWSAALAHDARDLLLDLLGTPSISGQEGNVGNVLNAWLRGAGIGVRQQRVRLETANVIASVGEVAPRLIFTTHLDTVAPDAQEWRITKPFHPVIENDRVYGVGASDAKGIVVSLALALRHLRYLCPRDWHGTVIGAFVTEEETTGYGSKVYADSLDDIVDTMAVVCEPTRLQHISLGNRGNAFVRLRAKGRERHGAYPADEYDAFRLLPSLHAFMCDLCERHADGSMTPSSSITSMNAGLDISDGAVHVRNPNSSPGLLEVTLDIRTTWELENDGFRLLKTELERFAATLAPLEVTYDFLMPPIPGQSINGSHPLVLAARGALTAVTGNEPLLTVAVGANDAVFFDQRGIPTLNEVGPGDFRRAHRPDEFITIDDVLRGAEMYVLIAKQILAHPGS